MTYFYFYQEFSYLYFLFSQELQELEIYKYPYLNLPCIDFFYFKNYENSEFLSTFYDAIHLETTYTASYPFQNSVIIPTYGY